MVLVFDLDDTLYPEISFVKSGFSAVADWLKSSFQISSEESLALMLRLLEQNGRGQVFNDVLNHYGLHSKKNIQKCLSVYRLHRPNIQLSKEGAACLKRFAHLPKYLVTDGNKVVQGNKVKALSLEPIFKKAYVTHRYGIQHAKPSPYCFHLIAARENALPAQIVYIADNPRKDFVQIKKEGFRTIRVLTGHFANETAEKDFDAEVSIQNLDFLTEEFLNEFFKK